MVKDKIERADLRQEIQDILIEIDNTDIIRTIRDICLELKKSEDKKK